MKSVPAKKRWEELTAAVIQLGKNQRVLDARITALEREHAPDIQLQRVSNGD
jgi:hypothetical protein